ncbi:unnamed protein product [Polarella glacialis]|uniref:Uncharacterized protein n=1 Tax=Polarella glacialis TaxID=89957 RepID=A0A813HFV8_POLGL|nr:unnamed protein product [Polarella glacialis]
MEEPPLRVAEDRPPHRHSVLGLPPVEASFIEAASAENLEAATPSRRAATPSGKNKSAAASRKQVNEWTPWKDKHRAHKDSVLLVEVFPDPAADPDQGRQCLLSAAADGAVRLYEIGNVVGPSMQVRQKMTLKAPGQGGCGAITCMTSDGLQSESTAEPPDGLAAAADLDSSAPGNAFASAILFGGYERGRIAAWSPVDGRLLADLPGHTAAVTAIRVRRAARHVTEGVETTTSLPAGGFASASRSARVAGLERFSFPESEDEGEADQTSPQDLTGENQVEEQEGVADLVSASIDGTVRVWCTGAAAAATDGLDKMGHGYCLFVLELGSRNPASDFDFLSSDFLAVGTWDGQLRIVDMVQRACTGAVQVTQAQIRSVCIVGTAKDDGEVRIFVGTELGLVSCQHGLLPQPPPPPALSEDLGWAVTREPLSLGWTPGCDMREGFGSPELRCSWQAHSIHVIGLQSWGNWLLSTSEDRLVRIWDGLTGSFMAEFYGHSGGVLATCVVPADKLLWTGSRDWSIRSWDLAEVQLRSREQAAMGNCDRESMKYEVGVSRAKALKKQAKPKAKAGASPRKR